MAQSIPTPLSMGLQLHKLLRHHELVLKLEERQYITNSIGEMNPHQLHEPIMGLAILKQQNFSSAYYWWEGDKPDQTNQRQLPHWSLSNGTCTPEELQGKSLTRLQVLKRTVTLLWEVKQNIVNNRVYPSRTLQYLRDDETNNHINRSATQSILHKCFPQWLESSNLRRVKDILFSNSRFEGVEQQRNIADIIQNDLTHVLIVLKVQKEQFRANKIVQPWK